MWPKEEGSPSLRWVRITSLDEEDKEEEEERLMEWIGYGRWNVELEGGTMMADVSSRETSGNGIIFILDPPSALENAPEERLLILLVCSLEELILVIVVVLEEDEEEKEEGLGRNEGEEEENLLDALFDKVEKVSGKREVAAELEKLRWEESMIEEMDVGEGEIERLISLEAGIGGGGI